MAAAEYDIVLEEDVLEPFSLTFEDEAGTPIDLTGCTATFRARLQSGETPYLDLTTENGGVILGGTAGTIVVVFPDAITTPRGLYKFIITHPDMSKTFLMRGVLNLKP